MCNEIGGTYDKIIITIVPSYTGNDNHSFVAVGIRNNTDGNKLVIFSGIPSYYGDTCIVTQQFLCVGTVTVVECCNLDDPDNGQVELSNTTVGSTANYTCNQGYIISSGDNNRTCEANGVWSGSPPSCECE